MTAIRPTTSSPIMTYRVFTPAGFSTGQPPGAAFIIHALEGKTMGTAWKVKMAAIAGIPLDEIRREILGILDTLIAQMSAWQPESDLSRFNHAPVASWHTLPDDFFIVLSHALRLAQESRGAYDPCIGQLITAWGFGPSQKKPEKPDRQAIDEAIRNSRWQSIALDPATKAAWQPGNVHLDLSAIAKGYAVDRLSGHLYERGIGNHLVEIGGELRGQGVKPNGKPWLVALEIPPRQDLKDCSPSSREQTFIALYNQAIATSGDYRLFFRQDGHHYSHTLDPRTGYPISHGLASVTVIHDCCMMADALATVLTVLGVEEGMAYAQQHAIAALFINRAGPALQERISPAWHMKLTNLTTPAQST